MQLVKLMRFSDTDPNDDYRPVYVDPQDVSYICDTDGPDGDWAHIILKTGHEMWVRESAKEVALLFDGTLKSENTVKRYRDRRATFAAQREEAWKYFEKAHYELSLGTQGYIIRQQVTTPCTAQSTVHLFVGDGPIFKVYGDFWDKHNVNHHCIACYSEKEHQLLVFDSDELRRYPANAEGMHFVDSRMLAYTDILEYGHADDVLGCCDGGTAREYCDDSHLSSFDDEEMPADVKRELDLEAAPDDEGDEIRRELEREEEFGANSDEDPGCDIGCACDMCEGFREAMEKDD